MFHNDADGKSSSSEPEEGSYQNRGMDDAKPASSQLTKKGHQRVFVTHDDYKDYSKDPAPPDTAEFADSRLQERLCNLKNGSVPFPVALHLMVDHAEANGYQHVICWQTHGRSFRVVDKDAFLSDLMPLFFRQKQFPSFCRQLQLYGFRRLAKRGPDKDSYYHKYFLRGLPHLAERMRRLPVRGTKLRPRYSPASEPDFRSMPHVFPPTTKDSKKVAPSNLLQVLRFLAARKRREVAVRSSPPPLWKLDSLSLLPGFQASEQGGVMQSMESNTTCSNASNAAHVRVLTESTLQKQPPIYGVTTPLVTGAAVPLPLLPLETPKYDPPSVSEYLLQRSFRYPMVGGNQQVQGSELKHDKPVWCHDPSRYCMNPQKANEISIGCDMDDWEPFFADIDLSDEDENCIANYSP